ncbi:MAG: hypothetical protein WC738_03355 [Candidatus Omnitrophota bacterium]|jgi:hypothetical protein
MVKKIIIRSLIIVSIFLGFYRVCCLEVLNSFEDYFKYRKMTVEDFRMKLNRQDASIINEIRNNVQPGMGVLVLDSEQYFISYYVYPVKLYKFRKGYYATSKKQDFRDVENKWLEDRNIKQALVKDDNDKFVLKNISEMKR